MVPKQDQAMAPYIYTSNAHDCECFGSDDHIAVDVSTLQGPSCPLPSVVVCLACHQDLKYPQDTTNLREAYKTKLDAQAQLAKEPDLKRLKTPTTLNRPEDLPKISCAASSKPASSKLDITQPQRVLSPARRRVRPQEGVTEGRRNHDDDVDET